MNTPDFLLVDGRVALRLDPEFVEAYRNSSLPEPVAVRVGGGSAPTPDPHPTNGERRG